MAVSPANGVGNCLRIAGIWCRDIDKRFRTDCTLVEKAEEQREWIRQVLEDIQHQDQIKTVRQQIVNALNDR